MSFLSVLIEQVHTFSRSCQPVTTCDWDHAHQGKLMVNFSFMSLIYTIHTKEWVKEHICWKHIYIFCLLKELIRVVIWIHSCYLRVRSFMHLIKSVRPIKKYQPCQTQLSHNMKTMQNYLQMRCKWKRALTTACCKFCVYDSSKLLLETVNVSTVCIFTVIATKLFTFSALTTLRQLYILSFFFCYQHISNYQEGLWGFIYIS